MHFSLDFLKPERRPIKRVTNGFSLIEIMITVTILGILISLAIPGLNLVRERAQNARLMNDWRTFATAYKQYILEMGNYPDDGDPGTIPTGMEDFLRDSQWTDGTFVGGEWDWDFNKYGITAGVSLVGSRFSALQMLQVDERLDDGDLGTGEFQLIAANRYSLIIEF